MILSSLTDVNGTVYDDNHEKIFPRDKIFPKQFPRVLNILTEKLQNRVYLSSVLG